LIKAAAPAINEQKRSGLISPFGMFIELSARCLSGLIVKKYGAAGLPEDTIKLNLKGSAGQSCGAFLAPASA
jgi:glutamate synthase (NADPH/NADH) large chain